MAALPGLGRVKRTAPRSSALTSTAEAWPETPPAIFIMPFICCRDPSAMLFAPSTRLCAWSMMPLTRRGPRRAQRGNPP